MQGKAYLIGAGCGRPDLITVRGLEILKQAEVIIYDYLVDKSLLENAKPGAELICCDRLAKKGRYSDGFIIHQEKIHSLMVKKIKQGKYVVRLKNGDPSIFSRTSQELAALVKEKIDFEIVPGVTAASAASAFSGIPLTDRSLASSVAFVTGHQDSTKEKDSIDWGSLSRVDTICLYMAVENLSNIVKRFTETGKNPDTPIAIIQDASLLTQKVLTGALKDIVKKAKKARVKAPAIIIIGEVVKLEKKFNWLKDTKKVLFTGISDERFFGKKIYFHLPVIKIRPIDDYREFDNALKGIQQYDWLVFTSRYGVKYFFQRLNKIGFDARLLNRVKIAAIGNSTKNRLLDYGIVADLVPQKDESSKGLINELKKIDLKAKKIFIPRSDLSDKGLKIALEKQGAEVKAVVAYSNVMPDDLPALNLEFFDEIMFTSPSGVRNFIKRYGRPAPRSFSEGGPPKRIKISCIGDVTAKEAKKFKLIVDSV